MRLFDDRHAAGQAIRWAHQRHGARLTFALHRYEDGRRLYSWTLDGTDTVLSIQTDPGDHDAHIYAGDPAYQVRIDTSDGRRVLDVLVALRLLPSEHSTLFHRGRLAGQVELTEELIELRRTYDIVEQAGVEVGQAVMGQ
ncbi:hypothetical protein [Krasilnikovia sp. MM14-A1259]|uniref:hypothetical protein n=1 Tax=Krasilnikovia sp. MM14-A1259 TaxID=3373539 RepID=UPI0038017E95